MPIQILSREDSRQGEIAVRAGGGWVSSVFMYELFQAVLISEKLIQWFRNWEIPLPE